MMAAATTIGRRVEINSSPETMVPKSCNQGMHIYGPTLDKSIAVHVAFWTKALPMAERDLKMGKAQCDKNEVRRSRFAVKRAKENLAFWKRMEEMEKGE